MALPKFTKRVLDIENRCEAASVFDVDNNGVPDIVCGEYWYEGPDFTMKHKICDIPYAYEYVWDFSDYPMDVDGDGWTDIVTASWWGDGLHWRKNPGPGGGEWETLKVMPLTNVETIRYFDIDGDGRAEIFPNCPGEPAFFVKLVTDENGCGTARFEKHVIGGGNAGHGIGFGDVDGDGLPEVLLQGGILHIPAGGVYAGEWTLLPEFSFDCALSVPVLAHDVNGDGLADIIFANGHGYGLFWLEQTKNPDGSRGWKRHVIDGAWSQYHDMQMYDIDGDGVEELVTGKRYKAHNGNDPGDDGEVFVCYYKKRDGAFYRHIVDYGNPAEGHSGVGIYFWLADVTGNGKTDIIAPGKEGLYLFEQE